MENKFSADKPVSQKTDDRFQRYEFSKSIAASICDRPENDCIVVGVFGAWGEGKTSVINFIENELNNNTATICIKFNPWRYSDENTLLMQFFQRLAEALDISLKNKKEKVGDFLKEYGEILSVSVPYIGNIGETASKAGKALGAVNIDTLKARIEKIIIDSKRKVVIFIDDIDRLDKEEIFSIFRLVKLNADFANTTYILSFDDEMVSTAIGEKFGTGDSVAGQNFLEKIIQVPLRIPPAQTEALKTFCFDLINAAFDSNKIELSKDNGGRFVLNFTRYVIRRLKTPRLAIRYANSLSFSLPMLDGEANLCDLMLIEAVKIFYPNHYSFIQGHPDYFLSGYDKAVSYNYDPEKLSEIKGHFERLSAGYKPKERSDVRNLLIELFPRLNEAFNNYASYPTRQISQWYKDKRICSSYYFNRYFTYCVIKGQIPDLVFKSFISSLKECRVDEIAKRIEELAEQSSPMSFIDKVRSFEEEYTWEQYVKLAEAINSVPEIFPVGKGMFLLGFESAYGQAAIFITQALKKINFDASIKFDFAKRLISTSRNFDFASEINRWIQPGKDEHEKLFSVEQNKDLEKTLLAKALKEAGDIPLFEKYPEKYYYLFSIWAKYKKRDLISYTKHLFKKEPVHSIQMLVALAPTIRSSSHPEPYKVDFQKADFDSLTAVLDKTFLRKTILNVYKLKDIKREPVVWVGREDNSQTELNIIRQFFHFYDNHEGLSKDAE